LALSGTFGRDTFDHLINNAGYVEYCMIPDVTEAAFGNMVKGPLQGAILPE
jgi:hypothetical protein